MITFSKINSHGRMGNQMWNIAAMIGFSKKYGVSLNMPDWHYAKYFSNTPGGGSPRGIQVKEKAFHFTPEYYDSLDWSMDMDFFGYFQSPRYFEHCKDEVMRGFQFEQSFKQKVREKYAEIFKKKTIAISCRVGDYVGNPGYVVLPAMYYILALYEHFKDWKDYNLIFLSDDIPWTKLHFGCLPNAYFATDFDNSNYFFSETAVEQLCLMSMADHFIIANSTFSEWGAMLGEKEDSIVVRPAHYLAGKLKQECDMKDHYPSHWIEFDHKGKKFDLRDCCFTIPVQFDHKDRQKNLDLNVCLLQRDFDCKIIIGEVNTNKFEYFRQWCDYRHFNLPCFHRTYVLNELAMQSKQEIVFNFDADISVAPMQLIVAVEKLRSGDLDFCYPYSGEFCRVDRHEWFGKLEKYLDVGIFAGKTFKGMMPGDALSVGGVVGYNKTAFFKAGGENEGYKSYGNEDVERLFRWKLLGHKAGRVNGYVFHMDHYVGVDSTNKHPNGRNNWAEWDRVSKMNKDEILEYVKTWRCYTE